MSILEADIAQLEVAALFLECASAEASADASGACSGYEICHMTSTVPS